MKYRNCSPAIVFCSLTGFSHGMAKCSCITSVRPCITSYMFMYSGRCTDFFPPRLIYHLILAFIKHCTLFCHRLMMAVCQQWGLQFRLLSLKLWLCSSCLSSKKPKGMSQACHAKKTAGTVV